jgi:hypothetical protein
MVCPRRVPAYDSSMLDTLFASGSAWFTVPALIGTALFVIRLVLLLLGFGADHDSGMDSMAEATHAGHADASALAADGHTHSADSFKLISVQSVAAFVMGFGWTAFAAQRGLDWDFTPSMALGTVGGFGIAGLLIWLLRSAIGLQASGNIDLRKAVGTVGEVYVEIPAGQQGKVRLILQERARFYTAVAETGAIDRHTRVQVTRVNADGVLVVKPA